MIRNIRKGGNSKGILMLTPSIKTPTIILMDIKIEDNRGNEEEITDNERKFNLS